MVSDDSVTLDGDCGMIIVSSMQVVGGDYTSWMCAYNILMHPLNNTCSTRVLPTGAVMRDVLFAKRASTDETVYDFFTRRMSQEVIPYAVEMDKPGNVGYK